MSRPVLSRTCPLLNKTVEIPAEFKTFHWLSHRGIRASIMLYMFGKRTCEFWWRFCFYFILFFCVMEAFLMKQLFHSRLLDMTWLKSTQWYSPPWLFHTISYPINAPPRGIIVVYRAWKSVTGFYMSEKNASVIHIHMLLQTTEKRFSYWVVILCFQW